MCLKEDGITKLIRDGNESEVFRECLLGASFRSMLDSGLTYDDAMGLLARVDLN
jgi:hypothetical protein